MVNIRTRALICVTLLIALVGPARGAVPAALDYIAPDSKLVVIVPSLDRLDQNANQLMGAIELTTVGSVGQLLRVLGPRDALDMSGSAALAMDTLPGEPNTGDALDALVIIPVIGFDDFAQRINATKQGELYTLDYGGSPFFAAPLGGGRFAAMSGSEKLVRGAKARSGQTVEHKAALGELAWATIERSDLSVLASEQGIASVLELTTEPLLRVAGAVAGVAPEAGGAQAAGLAELQALFTSQAERTAVSLSAGALGLKVEAVAKLKEPPAKQENDEPGSGLELAPEGRFLFAGATRFDHPIVQTALERAGEQGEPGLVAEKPEMFRRVLGALAETERASLVVYEPEGPLVMTGLLSSTLVQFVSDNPGDIVAAIRDVMESLNGTTIDGSELNVAYAPGRASIGDTSFDQWSIAGAPVNLMLFGGQSIPMGLVGAKGRDGYFSMGPEPTQLRRALAQNAGTERMPGNADIRRLKQFLPGDPFIEWYASFETIAKQFRPFIQAAMPGTVIPNRLPPIAGAMDADDESVRMTIFAPAPVLRVTVPLYRAMVRPAPQPTTPR